MKIGTKSVHLSSHQFLALGFAFIIAVGSILLNLPAAVKEGRSHSYIDALFTAASATCVTGLTVVDTGTHFSLFGQIVMLVMVQLGGIGFMTMTTWFALMMKRRISLRDRLILKESLNQSKMEGILRLIRKIVLYSITVEAVAAILYTIRLSGEMQLGEAVYFGVFHAVSIFNNAGFDLFGDFRSMTPFVDDVFINVVTMALVVCGGLGFIVMADLIEYPKRRKLSLHSKVVLTVTAILIVVGAVVIFIFEYTNAKTFGQLGGGSKVMASFFQSISLRSSGTSTVNIADMRQATQFFMIVMMFIGAAPGSTGGGIKITTFAVLVGSVIAMIRGKQDVVLFRVRLAKDQIYYAVTIAMTSVLFLSAATMVLSITENRDILTVMFEAASAFGTVGYSMGLTTELTTFGKALLIVLMFTGRIGLFTLAYALQPKVRKELFRYPEGKLVIG